MRDTRKIRQETLGTRLERARLIARERRLEQVVRRLRMMAAAREAARLTHQGMARAAADFAAELEMVRRRLRLIGPAPDRDDEAAAS